ncbi:MAG: S24 family peptidase [Candidatus Cloacimonas sp.]|jgi:SOS-response transcriptional repressor LexA|nr:S24 family peptidase [Candidatus Cloacimonas sp.]
METSDRVKLLIDNGQQTQKKFAETIGISPARLNNYLAQLSKIPQDILVKIAEKYNCSLTWLITGEGSMFQEFQAVDAEALFAKTIRLPICAEIAAGSPVEVYLDEPLGFVDIPTSLLTYPAPYLVFRVAGRSMEPHILSGDLVVCSRDWQGIEINNKIMAFRTADGITLKKLVLVPKQKTAWLMPINNDYAPVPYSKDTEDFAMLGILDISIRKYN